MEVVLAALEAKEIIKLPEDNFLYDFTYKGSILTSVLVVNY